MKGKKSVSPASKGYKPGNTKNKGRGAAAKSGKSSAKAINK